MFDDIKKAIKMFNGNDNNANLSILKNPFSSKKVDSISITIDRSMWPKEGDPFRFKAYVYFKNGDTSGNQRIEANDFNSLVIMIQNFISSLED